MTCLRPRIAYDSGLKTPSGKRKIVFRPRWPNQVSFPVPCGKCPACLERRRNDWVNRMRYELMSCDIASFLTLTYDDAHKPLHLLKEDLQRFFKRLRQARRDYGVKSDFRYFACGEYGNKHLRPHYHAIIFGLDFLSSEWAPDLVYYSPYPVYQSRLVSKIWPYGYNTVDRATVANMRYVAKYLTKHSSVPERNDGSDFAILDYPPFILHSVGLGRSFFVDVFRRGRSVDYQFKQPFNYFPSGQCVLPVNGVYAPVPLPSCLDRYAERFFPSIFQSVRDSRRQFALHSPLSRSPMARERDILFVRARQSNERLLDYAT